MNKFSILFGKQPESYIDRLNIEKKIYNEFNLDFPITTIYILSGVRGSGKTVLLTNIAEKFKNNNQWVVVDVNPNREILNQIAAGIYENSKVKHLFLNKSFSFSFKGLGFTIEGKEPVSNVKTILEKMLDCLNKQKKKLLITIDEVDNNEHMKAFAHDFQSLSREKYDVFVLMTGLYENVNNLQNNKNLTFLYRAPKIELEPLNITKIEKEYKTIFKEIDDNTINKISTLTNGYAFAYQLAGYLFGKYQSLDKMIDEFDEYLSIYSYEKIWDVLPNLEREFLKAFKNNDVTSNEIIAKTKFTIKEYSVYRDRLIKRGIIKSEKRGMLSLVLPRFNAFIEKQID